MIHKTEHHKVEVLGDLPPAAPIAYTIEADQAEHIMKVLRNMYARPVEAVVREYLANAYDAHVMSGRPISDIQIHLPTSTAPDFWLRDFGPGLEDIQPLFSYGASAAEKRQSNSIIGGFGIGCKCAWAVTDQFFYTNWHGGRKQVYRCYEDEEGKSQAALIVDEPSDEPTGIEIRIPTKSGREQDYRTALAIVAKYLEPKPQVTGVSLEWESQDAAFRQGSIEINGIPIRWELIQKHTYDSSQMELVLGWQSYMVDIDQLLESPFWRAQKVNTEDVLRWQAKFHVRLWAPIGFVALAPNRESLQYTTATKNLLAGALLGLSQSLKAGLEKELATYLQGSDPWTAYTMLSGALENGVDSLASLCQMLGVPIPKVTTNPPGIYTCVPDTYSACAELHWEPRALPSGWQVRTSNACVSRSRRKVKEADIGGMTARATWLIGELNRAGTATAGGNFQLYNSARHIYCPTPRLIVIHDLSCGVKGFFNRRLIRNLHRLSWPTEEMRKLAAEMLTIKRINDGLSGTTLCRFILFEGPKSKEDLVKTFPELAGFEVQLTSAWDKELKTLEPLPKRERSFGGPKGKVSKIPPTERPPKGVAWNRFQVLPLHQIPTMGSICGIITEEAWKQKLKPYLYCSRGWCGWSVNENAHWRLNAWSKIWETFKRRDDKFIFAVRSSNVPREFDYKGHWLPLQNYLWPQIEAQRQTLKLEWADVIRVMAEVSNDSRRADESVRVPCWGVAYQETETLYSDAEVLKAAKIWATKAVVPEVREVFAQYVAWRDPTVFTPTAQQREERNFAAGLIALRQVPTPTVWTEIPGDVGKNLADVFARSARNTSSSGCPKAPEALTNAVKEVRSKYPIFGMLEWNDLVSVYEDKVKAVKALLLQPM